MKSFADSVLVIEVLNADALKMVNADAIQELHAATSLDPTLSSLLSSPILGDRPTQIVFIFVFFLLNCRSQKLDFTTTPFGFSSLLVQLLITSHLRPSLPPSATPSAGVFIAPAPRLPRQ